MIDVVQARTHGDKLHALADNAKLPASDKPRVEAQIQTYNTWVAEMNALRSEGDELLNELVSLLNAYKKSVEFDLIFCSDEDFLYRQKGQLKLDNTILEESFRVCLMRALFQALQGKGGLSVGRKQVLLAFPSKVHCLRCLAEAFTSREKIKIFL